MSKSIDYIVADPAGNVTILVLSPTDRADYQTVAHALLEACPEAEQVGYILPEADYPRMDMCGLEFCGNASRAFAFYDAVQHDPFLTELKVQVSGCDHPLQAWIDAGPDKQGTAMIQMPVPTDIEDITIPLPDEFTELAGRQTVSGRLVHMDGISHLIIDTISDAAIAKAGRSTMDNLFSVIRDCAYEMTGMDFPAFGVMFVDREADRMTPVVYVRDVDTVYFEGSCASGSTAAAFAMATSDLKEQDQVSYTLRQPAGSLHVDISGEAGEAKEIRLSGSMGLSEVRQLIIEE